MTDLQRRLMKLEALSAAKGDNGMVMTTLSPEAQALLLETCPWISAEDAARPQLCSPVPLSAEAWEQLKATIGEILDD